MIRADVYLCSDVHCGGGLLGVVLGPSRGRQSLLGVCLFCLDRTCTIWCILVKIM